MRMTTFGRGGGLLKISGRRRGEEKGVRGSNVFLYRNGSVNRVRELVLTSYICAKVLCRSFEF